MQMSCCPIRTGSSPMAKLSKSRNHFWIWSDLIMLSMDKNFRREPLMSDQNSWLVCWSAETGPTLTFWPFCWLVLFCMATELFRQELVIHCLPQPDLLDLIWSEWTKNKFASQFWSEWSDFCCCSSLVRYSPEHSLACESSDFGANQSSMAKFFIPNTQINGLCKLASLIITGEILKVPSGLWMGEIGANFEKLNFCGYNNGLRPIFSP